MSGFFTKDTAVLDVGSGKMVGIVGARRAESVFNIRCFEEKDYSGFCEGEFLDEDETREAAESVMGVISNQTRSKRLFIGVPAEFTAVVNKNVTINLDRRRRVVDADIDYLLKKGDTFGDSGYVSINTSAVYFSVDTTDKLYTDVRGMTAARVEASVTYILCEKKFTALFDSAAAAAGFREIRYVSSPWAQCIALFEKEQRDFPFAVADIGYISSSVCVARGDGLLDLKSFSLGGGHISADLFEALEIPFELAERARPLIDLNLSYTEGAVLVGDGEYTVYASDAGEVARARLDIIGEIIADALAAFSEIPSYVPLYLTGEGVSEMRGAAKYLSERLGKNIEIIAPKLAGFAKPAFSSPVSLLIVAESARPGFGESIKSIFSGGKN